MKLPSSESRLSLEFPADASTSEQSTYDQETTSHSTSSNGEMLMKRNFWNSPLGLINPTLLRMVFAEALGTFMLMFCICGIMASMEIMGVRVGLMEYAATAALTVVVVVFSIGPISGAHINPAVTLAFAAVGHFPWSKVPFYVVAQVGGSILATYTGKLVYGLKAEFVITRPLHGCTSAFFVELLATFIVLFLTASLTNDPQSTGPLSGFVVGVAIGLAVLISGPISGGSMNPARSLGPAIVSWKFGGLWIYVVAPVLGAVAGVVLYRLLRLQGWSCKPNSTPTTTHQHNPL
ncbi:PREDICTED: probable aquaporin NIP7-1 [Nicotiana attenuata]|uniref:Aquaporin nip7-1 n=1 Tax=Nicotiana attenuata TaxID=49451 RepID=A0A1J6I1F2_NICAT|nr:PREDICTED: probable aquaporin NIP7-1 [Nicotiana attenuata]OIS98893.1 putative aquaporin nip7-1 [Nicotiana attenuata]